MRERELKLAIGDTFVVPQLDGGDIGVHEVRVLPELELGSTYFDTADLRLARHGVTLRFRIGDEGGSPWTLKLPVTGHDASEREEIGFDGGAREVPTAARELVSAWVRRAPLAPAATLITRRRRWLLIGPEGKEIGELVNDEVSVMDGDRVVARFRELELESRGPSLETLAPIARRLQRAGAVTAEPLPKAIRALGPRAAGTPDVVVPAADPAGETGDAVRSALALGALRLLTNDAATRLGDTEALHQMRVAARRLRSDLRTFADMVDNDWATGLRDELRWLGGLLGAVRDADVQLEALHREADDLRPAIEPLLDAVAVRREHARGELLDALRSPRYLDLLERLVRGSREPMLTERAMKRARKLLPLLLDQPWQRLRRDARRLGPDDPDEAYHQVRIRAKRLRYAAEAASPFVAGGSAAATKLARRATEVQDLLGRAQDATVMAAEVQRVLREQEGNAAYAFAAGRLLERQHTIRRNARRAFPATWRRLRKAARRWRSAR